RDAATAAEWIRAGKGSEAERARAAANLLEASIEKEEATVASIASLGPPSDTALALAITARRDALRRAAALVRESVVPAAGPATGAPEAELRLEKRAPRKAAATLSDWLALQRRVTGKRAEEARRRREQRDAPTPKAVRGKTPAPPPAPAPEQG